MTMFQGARVKWEHHPTLILPGETGIPSKELHRRQLEQKAQASLLDRHALKLARTETARDNLKALVGLPRKTENPA